MTIFNGLRQEMSSFRSKNLAAEISLQLFSNRKLSGKLLRFSWRFYSKFVRKCFPLKMKIRAVIFPLSLKFDIYMISHLPSTSSTTGFPLACIGTGLFTANHCLSIGIGLPSAPAASSALPFHRHRPFTTTDIFHYFVKYSFVVDLVHSKSL